jgi:hypothetical protein
MGASKLPQTMFFEGGYQITQASNYHVTVRKDGRLVLHAEQDHVLSGEELLDILKFAIEIRETCSRHKCREDQQN